MAVRYVFNAEEGYENLGQFVGYDEGVVLYQATYRGDIRQAPDDCVVVREVTYAEQKEAMLRFGKQIESSAQWGDTTGLNGIVQIAVEMLEYASVMGAALSVDQAYANLRREQKVRYIGTRAHSRQFEEEKEGVST